MLQSHDHTGAVLPADVKMSRLPRPNWWRPSPSCSTPDRPVFRAMP